MSNYYAIAINALNNASFELDALAYEADATPLKPTELADAKELVRKAAELLNSISHYSGIKLDRLLDIQSTGIDEAIEKISAEAGYELGDDGEEIF